MGQRGMIWSEFKHVSRDWVWVTLRMAEYESGESWFTKG